MYFSLHYASRVRLKSAALMLELRKFKMQCFPSLEARHTNMKVSYIYLKNIFYLVIAQSLQEKYDLRCVWGTWSLM